ncbi:13278_t:CDS:2, partial [Funneliformis mosseae]
EENEKNIVGRRLRKRESQLRVNMVIIFTESRLLWVEPQNLVLGTKLTLGSSGVQVFGVTNTSSLGHWHENERSKIQTVDPRLQFRGLLGLTKGTEIDKRIFQRGRRTRSRLKHTTSFEEEDDLDYHTYI